MKFSVFFFAIVSVCLQTESCFRTKYVVRTKYGPVIGLTQLSKNGREYFSYRGVPFAKPPVGHLRFKAPEPPNNWSILEATKDAPYCIQINYLFMNPKVEGSEDCLYLNVYVPKIRTTKLLPVMVFIHWGGFFTGRGSSDYTGPEYLMDKDVILVTFNYRLGVFGFFSTLDDAAPGNFGLKDQVLALRFVQENIEYFGGDRNKVTIFGQSSGGGSVSLHLVSPGSRGLFQQAISQSGVSMNLWSRPMNQIVPGLVKKLAKLTGCENYVGNSSLLVNCIRKVEASNLMKTTQKFKYFSVEPLTPYVIVTEKKSTANPAPFLTKDPVRYLLSGKFLKIPWIVGNVQNEGDFRAEPLVRQLKTLKTLNQNFTTLLPKMLQLEASAPNNTNSLFKNLTKFYLGGKNSIDPNNPKSVQAFINLYSDRSFYYGTYQAVILQSQKGHSPIWVYNFNYKGEYSYGDKFAATYHNINFDWGVSHCDDLLYLFRSPAIFPDLKQEMDLQMIDKMVTLWTNFAIFGDPDPLQTVGWKSLKFANGSEVRNSEINILHIVGNYRNKTVQYKIRNGFYTKRVQFWASQNITDNFFYPK